MKQSSIHRREIINRHLERIGHNHYFLLISVLYYLALLIFFLLQLLADTSQKHSNKPLINNVL